MKRLSIIKFAYIAIVATVIFVSCRGEDPVLPPAKIEGEGFYVLNEGNMGTNKASLDFFDYIKQEYQRNIFPTINPDVEFKLGDVGNDLKIYGSRLYAVINLSNIVVVMDKNTAKYIGKFSVPNGRYIEFNKDKCYVTSYAGKVGDGGQLGYVAEFDTATLEETRRVVVGHQPDGLAIVGDKLYVANSGGYNAPNYDKELSVIDLNTFKEIKKIEIAINLNLIKKDDKGNLYITSRGNYGDIPSNIYKFNTETEEITPLNFVVNNFTFTNDYKYIYSVWYDYSTKERKFIKYDVENNNVITEDFIATGSEDEFEIVCPYAVAYNDERGEIYVADAKTFVVPGEIMCFSTDGTLKWKEMTGDIPSSIVFLNR